jgi:hypothetical protein
MANINEQLMLEELQSINRKLDLVHTLDTKMKALK